MKTELLFKEHRLFFVLLVLFFVVALIDITNADSLMYQGICGAFSVYIPRTCSTFYDLPIWEIYLSLGILTLLYHVHGEIRTTNRHLRGKK